MLANGAEYVDGKLYLLGGDFDTINASGVPLVYPMLVMVVKFWFEPGETHHPNVLRVVPLALSGVFWLWGTRHLDRDTALAPTRMGA